MVEIWSDMGDNIPATPYLASPSAGKESLSRLGEPILLSHASEVNLANAASEEVERGKQTNILAHYRRLARRHSAKGEGSKRVQ
jgi:hypothetical protein